MKFGEAIELLKHGKKVARKGWNGKGMWIIYVHKCEIPYRSIGIINLNPFFVIKNANHTMSTWVPSISDSLAEDWMVLD